MGKQLFGADDLPDLVRRKPGMMRANAVSKVSGRSIEVRAFSDRVGTE
jgi:hypothetical protein